MAKTAEYTKRAIDNYRNKFDMIQLRLPKETGLKDRIKNAYGKDLNAKIIELLEKDLEQRERQQDNYKMPEETKAHIYENITGREMPGTVKVIQPKKSPDSVIFDGLEVSPERAKEISEKLDQQLATKEDERNYTPKRDSFTDTLARYRRENSEGKLALNVREDI